MKTEIQRFNENAEIIKYSFANKRTDKALLICSILNGNLADHPAFEASINLRSTGAPNDYDGIRSASVKLAMQWESEMLNPAMLIARRMQAKSAN